MDRPDQCNIAHDNRGGNNNIYMAIRHKQKILDRRDDYLRVRSWIIVRSKPRLNSCQFYHFCLPLDAERAVVSHGRD